MTIPAKLPPNILAKFQFLRARPDAVRNRWYSKAVAVADEVQIKVLIATLDTIAPSCVFEMVRLDPQLNAKTPNSEIYAPNVICCYVHRFYL